MLDLLNYKRLLYKVLLAMISQGLLVNIIIYSSSSLFVWQIMIHIFQVPKNHLQILYHLQFHLLNTSRAKKAYTKHTALTEHTLTL